MGDTESLQAALIAWREVISKSRPGSPLWFRANFALARTQLSHGNRSEARATIARLESSHPELGGADSGKTTYSIPKEQLLSIFKRDVVKLKGMLREAGLA